MSVTTAERARAGAVPAVGPAAVADLGAVVAHEHEDAAIAMPMPDECNTAVIVSFERNGPSVETTDDVGRVGEYTSGDLFYSDCTLSGGPTVFSLVVPNDNPFTTVEGDPDPETCAAKAKAQPTLKTVPVQSLTPGAGFCLISANTNLLIHLTITHVAPNRDLAATATVWAALDS